MKYNNYNGVYLMHNIFEQCKKYAHKSNKI